MRRDAQAVDVGTSCWLMDAVRVHTGIQDRVGLRLEPRLENAIETQRLIQQSAKGEGGSKLILQWQKGKRK
jgi:hypothetical protein